MWLHHSGVLSASPDGLVGEDSVLEAKCPYTHRDLTIEEAIKTSNFYLEKKDGEIVLKRDHVYWHQVQGHLFLTKRKKCYFVVWTLKDFVVLEIQRDDSWEIKIEELKEFYLKHQISQKLSRENSKTFNSFYYCYHYYYYYYYYYYNYYYYFFPYLALPV